MSVEAWIDFGATLGLDAVDFGQAWSRDRRPGALAALRRRLEDRGIRAGMIRGVLDVTHPDPGVRRATTTCAPWSREPTASARRSCG